MTLGPLDGSADPFLFALRGQRGEVTAAVFSPDGRYLVTGDRQGIARVWKADGTGDAVSLPWPADRAAAAALSPDGNRFAAVSSAGVVQVRPVNGEPDSLVLGEHRDVTAAAFNPDGTRLVTTSLNGTTRQWDAVGGRSLAVLGDTTGPAVHTAAFSPNGRRLLTVTSDSTARLWEAEPGEALATLRGHTDQLTRAAFGPDGRVVTASKDGTARVWDAQGTGDPVVLKDDGRSIQAAAFSRDGEQIWTVSADGSVRRWTTISHERLRAALRAATNLCLNPDFRQLYLGQSAADALARFERCERQYGREPQPD
jgi:WD40 repeat protein